MSLHADETPSDSGADALKLGFLLYEYFPYGGLQRDCLGLAKLCSSRGHAVTIFTRSWAGELPTGVGVECLGDRGWTNVRRNKLFQARLRAVLPARDLDAVVGFNKLPGLDLYFGADPCYVAKMNRLRPAWYRWTARYRHYRSMEAAVFARGMSTHILLLTAQEIALYEQAYGTEPERFHVLPPTLARRNVSAADRHAARERIRRASNWDARVKLLLLVGSGFRVKGVDRAIDALAALPERLRRDTRLVVIGQDRPDRFAAQARRLEVAERVHFLGPRDDVPLWLQGADLLLHPAYSEAAGMVLLEALTCGLPVLTTATCGYAFHVERAQAGRVLTSPFSQEACNQALAEMLECADTTPWSARGLAYAAREDLYSGHEQAAGLIETVVGAKIGARQAPGAHGARP